MFQKILVALDSSESSRHIFEKALDLAKTNQAELMLLHVLSPTDEAYPMPIYPSFDGIYPIQHDELMRSAMQQFAVVEQAGYDKLRSHSLKAEAENVLTHITQTTGDPGELICSTAKQWSADLIVIGRRGRSALTELLLGSVSNYVMHHASCSVLVVQAALVSA